MKPIPPFGDKPPPAPKVIQTNQTQKATQVPSGGKKIPSATNSFLTFLYRLVTFQWSTAKYELKQLKIATLDQLMSSLPEDMNTKEVRAIFNSFSNDALKNLSSCTALSMLFDRAKSKATKPKEVYTFFKSDLQKIAIEPSKITALNNIRTANTLLKGRLTESMQHQLSEILINRPQELATNFNNFVSKAQTFAETKVKGPLIAGNSSEGMELIHAKNAFTGSITQADDMDFLKACSEELIFSSVLMPAPILEENLEALSAPLSTLRLVPLLRSMSQSSPLAFHNEFHVSMTPLPKNLNDMLDFKGHLEIYHTDPRTMQTVTMQIPLPFEGTMSGEQAHKWLELLTRVEKNPKKFEEIYSELKFNPNEQEEIKTKCNTFLKQSVEERFKSLDLLACQLAETLSPFEDAPTLEFKASPSLSKGFLTMKQKRIYLDGTQLSLLPPKKMSSLQPYATVDSRLIESAKKGLLKEVSSPGITPVMIGENQFEYADVTFQTSDLKVADTQLIVLKTTIAVGSKSIERTTYYPIPKGKTKEETIQDLVNSHHLERDLLLAKATFMEKKGS